MLISCNANEQFFMVYSRVSRLQIKTFIILLQLNKKRPNRLCQKQLSQSLIYYSSSRTFYTKYERYKLKTRKNTESKSRTCSLFVYVDWAVLHSEHLKLRAVGPPSC